MRRRIWRWLRALAAVPGAPRSRRALAVAVVSALAVAGCGSPPVPLPGSPDALVAYLGSVVGADPAVRQREVASWQLDAALWDRTVVSTYRPLHAEYQRAFAAALPALVAQLAAPGPVTARRHYAGDPRLTLAQARDRWALPPLFPSLVAEVGDAAVDLTGVDPRPAGRAVGVPTPALGPTGVDPRPAGRAVGVPTPALGVRRIDAVFIPDGERWRALIGLDAVVRARVTALDPACAAHLALAGPTGRCSDVGAAIAEAALRTDRDRLAHVCRLAETLCGKEAP